LPINNITATILLQSFYSPLDFAWDYPGEPVPERKQEAQLKQGVANRTAP